MVSKIFKLSLTIISALYVVGCAEAPNASSNPQQNAQQNNSSTHAEKKIYARDGWTPTGLYVTAGQKVKINFTGTWSGGQRDTSLTGTLFCGAEGCNGYIVNAQTGAVQNQLGFDTSECGLADGTQVDESYGPTSSPRTYHYTVPAGNRGLCCSNKSRVLSVLYGSPNIVVKPYDCAPAPRNALIGKILLDGEDPTTVAPFLVGRNYGTNPLTTSRTGQLYLSINDLVHGLGDNEGMLYVTVDIVP